MTKSDPKDPGRRWRVHSGDDGGFDEIAVGGWLHVERMDHRTFYVAIGNEAWNVWVSRTGKVTMVPLDVAPRQTEDGAPASPEDTKP